MSDSARHIGITHLKAILHKYGINEPEIGPSNRAGNEGIQYGEMVMDLLDWHEQMVKIGA